MLYKDDVPNVEVGVEVEGPFAADGSVVPSALPAGETAMIVHRGPVRRPRVRPPGDPGMVRRQRPALAGPRWEIYGDWHDDPTQLETEVYYLLRRGEDADPRPGRRLQAAEG